MEITTLKERCCSCVTTLLAVMCFAAATSVYAANLELEGNIENNGATDWEDIFDVSGNNVPTEANPLPAGYVQSVFVRDFVPGASGPDISTFTTGSKDTLNITPGWECTRSNNVNDKTDIVNAYATASSNGDIVVYFAMERYSNEGTGNIGFWFLKDGSTGCPVQSNGPKTAGFTGNHMDGDILIVAEFDNGGSNVTVVAYRWVGGAGGFLDPTPIAADSKCVGNGAAQNLCGIVNGNLLDGYGVGTEVPWLTETKKPGNTPSNDLDVSEFFEGKINLSALGLVGCFTKYMAVTRSSTSLTATIFDYALGDFSLCSIDVTKACTTGIDNPVINAAGDKVITTFDVTVTNNGAGSVSNVTIEEDITLSAGESCELIAINGDTTGLPTDISNGSPIQVAATLAKDASVVARVRCETNDNPLDNMVTARAKSVASAGTPDLVESYDMTAQQLCPLAVNPMIDVNKTCTDVRLTTSNNILTMEVEVDVTLTNTSSEKLINVLISNVVGDTAGGTPIALQHVAADGETPLPAFDGELAPGETVYFESVYIPTVVKNGGTDPSTATFEDRVDASGVGALSGATATDFSTAECPLCPPHED